MELILFGKSRKNAASARASEEQLYEQVYAELSQGQRRGGLWAKALSKGGGSEEKASALYIQYRVQSIKDESEISSAAENSEFQHREQVVSDLLSSKGYELIPKRGRWVIKEPLGGRASRSTLEELEEYARSRGV